MYNKVCEAARNLGETLEGTGYARQFCGVWVSGAVAIAQLRSELMQGWVLSEQEGTKAHCLFFP